MFTKNNILLGITLLFGTIFHIWALNLNEVMKIADSFAYLQMSYFLGELSIKGLGSGWFGFVYSLPISIVNVFLQNDFFAAQIVNILLLNISAFLVYKISKEFLTGKLSILVVGLFLLSPTFLHFNIHILSENVYIPIFLLLFLSTWNFIKNPHSLKQVIYIACLLGLLYLTRAEAFIYILSIGLISLYLLFQKKLSIKNFFLYGFIFFLSFFLFVFPYLIHIHNVTGNWELTNKGASNYRQAELRGQDQMDDAGFEQAVGELTADKHHLIAGFAGGMNYDAPQIEGNLKKSILENPNEVFFRVTTNWKKLFTLNLPEIFLGKSPHLFWSQDSRFSGSYVFLIFSIFPLFIVLFGIRELWKKQKDFFVLSLFFFLPACIFFTLFFTLNRYFLIFLPLLLITFVFGLQELKIKKGSIHKVCIILFILNYICVLALSNLVYYNSEKQKDAYYTIKAEAGIWLKENNITNINSNILERFPIVTYYSGSKNRWITPYTNDIGDITEYARYNNIEYLVVDTLDFLTYRPTLADVLENIPNDMELVKEWRNEKNQEIRVYRFTFQN